MKDIMKVTTTTVIGDKVVDFIKAVDGYSVYRAQKQNNSEHFYFVGSGNEVIAELSFVISGDYSAYVEQIKVIGGNEINEY